MKTVSKKFLAVLISVLMAVSMLAVPVFADEEPAVAGIEITEGSYCASYHTGESLDLTGLEVNVNYADGTSAVLPPEDYTVNPQAGTILDVGELALTAVYGDFSDTVTVTVTDHAYDPETHICNEVRSDGTVCGLVEPEIEFIGVSGTSYPIYLSDVEVLDDDNFAYIWKMGNQVPAVYLKDMLDYIGAGEDLGDCSLVFAAADGYSVPLDADWLGEMGLFITNDGQIRSIMMNHDNDNEGIAIMPDGTEVSGGWYSPGGLATITAYDHSFEDSYHCGNLIGAGKNVTAPCGETMDADVYTVSSGTQLAEIAEMVNAGNDFSGKTVMLEKAIDLSSYENWTPIGTAEAAFAGTFDGNGKSIAGLSVTDGTGGYKGLFGNNAGTIENLIVSGSIGSENAFVGGADYYGVIAYNTGDVFGVISGLSVYPGTGDTYSVGGVVGCNDGGNVSCCGFDGTIASDTAKNVFRAGGIVGYQKTGTVEYCYNHGDVEAWNYKNANWGTGGIVGSMDGGSISYCYSTGTIRNGKGDSGTGGKNGTGGIAGGIAEGNVDHCYAAGDVYGPNRAGVLIGKVGNGTYDHIYSYYDARSYNSNSGGLTDESGANYFDGSTENADGTIYFDGYGKAALGGNYNTEWTVTNAYTKKADEIITQAFADELNENEEAFLVSCNHFPVLFWEESAVPHTPAEPVEEITEPGYDTIGYAENVTYCAVCGEELKREFTYEIPTLKTQAAAAAAAAEEAAKEAASYTGEAAVAPAETAVEAAEAAKEAAAAAYAAAVAEGLDESVIAEAAAAVDAADQALTDAKEAEKSAETAADEAADVRDAAVATLAQIENMVNKANYTAASYAVYEEAYNAFNALVLDESATASQLRSARTAVTRAYTNLQPKAKQTLKASVTGKSVGYAVLAKAAKTYSLVTVAGNEGKLTFTKASGSSSYAAVDKTTGKITLKKGTPAGTQTVKVKVAAAATDDYLAASKTVTVKITVTKAAQSPTVKPVAKTVSLTKVKSAAQTVKGAITVRNAQGTVTYKKTGGDSKLAINAKTGVITVKKGTAKGTHNITVKVTAAGDKNYKAKTKTVTVKITVK